MDRKLICGGKRERDSREGVLCSEDKKRMKICRVPL